MNKYILILPLFLLVVTSILALSISQGYWFKGGTLEYLAGDSSLVMPKNFAKGQVHLKEYYYSRNGASGFKVRGNLIIQAYNDDGKRARLSISLKDLVEIHQSNTNRLYARYSGRVVYGEKGKSPITFESDNIRIDVNKQTRKVNVEGLEETDYEFKVIDMSLSKSRSK